MADTSLTAELRRRIQDVRPSRSAFTVGVSDDTATSALLEVTNGHLILTAAGGVVQSLDVPLAGDQYNTVGKLHQFLSRAPGLTCALDEDSNPDHSSVDIDAFGPTDVRTNGLTLRHHRFSDLELEDVAKRAVQRHNPSFLPVTLPPQEWVFVMNLAVADVCRIMAMDVQKRRGVDADVAGLLSLAQSHEATYENDTRRLARAIQSPREANPNVVSEGDVTLGKFVRRSLRTGFQAPLSQTLPGDAAVLLDPNEFDVEDDNIRVVWQRNKEYTFYSYELWMDSKPQVERDREGGIIFHSTPNAFLTQSDTYRDPARRVTSSTLVFRSFGGNSNSSRSSFSTFVEEFGQLIRSFAVSNLESSTTYYFRLYVVGINYTVVGSNVVCATTKPLRCRFISEQPPPNNPNAATGVFLNKKRGPAGTVVTVTFDPAKGAFTASHVLKLGEKTLTPTILGPYEATFPVPQFENFGVKGMSVMSPNGLTDARPQSFEVTAS